jgi:Domain of unknown function (DUF4388)
MSLSGNLRTMALPDILQWISMGKKSGTLHLESGSVRKRIVFREGSIVTSWSNDPRESFGQFLIRDRLITEEQLFRALLQQESEGRLIGSILVSAGIIEEDDIKQTLRSKAEETIYDLFLWPEGHFEFKEGELPDNVLIHIDLKVTTVVLEGIRRVDEWERIRKVIPSPRTTFRVCGAPLDVEDPTDRQLLGLVAAAKSVADIALETRRSDFDAAALVFDLLARDLIAIDRTGEQEEGDPVGRIQELLALAYQKLQSRQYEHALKAYEAVLARDRLNQHAKKGLLEVAEARDRARAARAIPLSKVPVLAVDLASLTREDFDPQEGFVLSRVNGQWDVQSILKLCPMSEEDALRIFARLLDRNVIELR